MGRIVIVAYRPRPGMAEDLVELVREHAGVLRSRDLITDREPVTMRAEDGTLVEVFEWKDTEAIAHAHEDAAVRALWSRFESVCDYVPIASVTEAGALFSEFEPL